VLKPLPGFKDKRGRCVKPSKKNPRAKRCTRYRSVGSFTHTDLAGPNTFHFTGRVRGRKLKPGGYKLQAIPRFAGTAGQALTTSFRIIK
jgi:hypothetical protein